MNIPRVIIIVVTSLLFTFSTFAQTAVSLTPQNVEGFINSVRDLQEIGKKYGAEEIVNPDISGSDSMAGAVSPFSTAIAQMQGQQAYDEMLAVIKQHGFGPGPMGDNCGPDHASVRCEQHADRVATDG